jgi:hypothetical protein
MAVILNNTNPAMVLADDPRVRKAELAAVYNVNLVLTVQSPNISPRLATAFMSGRLATGMKKRAPKRGTAAKQLCNATARHRQATMLPYPQGFSLLGASSQYTMLTAMHSYALWLASVGPNPARDAFLQLHVRTTPDDVECPDTDGVNNHVHSVTGCHALVRVELRSKLRRTAGMKRFPGLHIPADVIREFAPDESRSTGITLFDFKNNLPGTSDFDGTIRTYMSRRPMWLPYAIPQGLHTDKFSNVKTMAVAVQQILDTGVVTILVLKRATEAKLAAIYDLLHVGVAATVRQQRLVAKHSYIVETVGAALAPDFDLPLDLGCQIADRVLQQDTAGVMDLAVHYAAPTLTEARATYNIVSKLNVDGSSTDPTQMITQICGKCGPTVMRVGRCSRLIMCLNLVADPSRKILTAVELPPIPPLYA